MLAFCSMLAGYDGFEEMALFSKSQLAWFKQFLELKNGVPSHDVFRNIFMMVKPEAIAEILSTWCGQLSGKHVAIDGKAMRGTYDREAGRCTLHVLRAWVGENSLSAGHVTCLEKSNEIEALPRLLKALQLKGAIVTIDAMGCQTDIVEDLHQQQADYLIALKKNQRAAYQSVVAHFAQLDAQSSRSSNNSSSKANRTLLQDQSVELSHGRFVRRECDVSADVSWYEKSWKWPGLKSVVRIRRRSQRGAESAALVEEVHYFITSLAPNAKELARLIRAHWSVENSCHHVLDVTYGEDHCQVRDKNAAHGLSLLREMTAHLHKRHPSKASINLKRRRAALDEPFRNQLLALIPLPHFDA